MRRAIATDDIIVVLSRENLTWRQLVILMIVVTGPAISYGFALGVPVLFVLFAVWVLLVEIMLPVFWSWWALGVILLCCTPVAGFFLTAKGEAK